MGRPHESPQEGRHERGMAAALRTTPLHRIRRAAIRRQVALARTGSRSRCAASVPSWCYANIHTCRADAVSWQWLGRMSCDELEPPYPAAIRTEPQMLRAMRLRRGPLDALPRPSGVALPGVRAAAAPVALARVQGSSPWPRRPSQRACTPASLTPGAGHARHATVAAVDPAAPAAAL